jgi:pimeloyl-ACP methyl ester carboxylesterase
LVKEARETVDVLIDQSMEIIFAGHSLGGTAAFCLCGMYQGSRAVILNGGAVATNPVVSGPGPGRVRFYHVFGDLVSTHMSPAAAEVVRIKKPDTEFSVIWPHSSERILKSDGPWTYASADEEDEAFQKWGSKYRPGWAVLSPYSAVTSFVVYLKKKDIVKKSPIPGSSRWLRMQ